MLSSPSCTRTIVAVKEQMGYAKRDQLVDSVQEARDEQAKAKARFRSALDEFLAVTQVKPDELAAKYEQLRARHERCEAAAEAVSDQIADVERVAELLFEEWHEELGEYASPELRANSAKQLAETRTRYDELMTVMRRAESRMAPVLTALGDQVLFLKHNLNARAIAALESTAASVESSVSRLMLEMESAIAEADKFIEQMGAADEKR